MTQAQTNERINDGVVLSRFLQGELQPMNGTAIRSRGSDVYDHSSGWYFLYRTWPEVYLLSLDNPGMTPTFARTDTVTGVVAGVVAVRTAVMAAAAAAGAAVLPVAFQPYSQACDRDSAPPKVIDVNTAFESVFSIKNRYYLSGYDTQEPQPLYFLCRLPHRVKTVDAARESLKPRSVKEALAAGRNVVRQGDIFAIQSDIKSKKTLKEMGATFNGHEPIYRTAHTADELAQLPDGVMLARGFLHHHPAIIGQHRNPDHISRKLPGKAWWWLTRNTVPKMGH
jgi:hypothetical protein